MAGRMKVMDLAKELGVTSKDLVMALEAMGHKGMRALSPLPVTTASERGSIDCAPKSAARFLKT